jgi:hypothetical protein
MVLTVIGELVPSSLSPLFYKSVVFRDGLEHRSCTVRLAGVILHGPGCLGTRTAEALIERVDALLMCAIVTEQDNTIRVFADFVHD